MTNPYFENLVIPYSNTGIAVQCCCPQCVAHRRSVALFQQQREMVANVKVRRMAAYLYRAAIDRNWLNIIETEPKFISSD